MKIEGIIASCLTYMTVDLHNLTRASKSALSKNRRVMVLRPGGGSHLRRTVLVVSVAVQRSPKHPTAGPGDETN